MPEKHAAVCNKRDWVGFSPIVGENRGPREGPAIILFPAGLALRCCVWEFAHQLRGLCSLSAADLFWTSFCADVRGGA